MRERKEKGERTPKRVQNQKKKDEKNERQKKRYSKQPSSENESSSFFFSFPFYSAPQGGEFFQVFYLFYLFLFFLKGGRRVCELLSEGSREHIV